MSGENCHDPAEYASELSRKLAARYRHVCMLIGAGAGKACGLPDVDGLQALVLEALEPTQKAILERLLVGKDLEQVLSHVRRIAALLGEGETLGGLTAESAKDLDGDVCSAIVQALDADRATLDPMLDLATWASGTEKPVPIELFTVNYDLLLELGLEAVRALYFDGFVGSVRGRFQTSAVELGASRDEEFLPAAFVRLWKLHGSVNWAWTSGAPSEVVRCGGPVTGTAAAAIYPSDTKYDESRRVPFVVLMDRFRRALSERETILLMSGYSFRDEHLNEMIFDAAVRHARSEYVALCHGEVPDDLAARAVRSPSLTVLGRTEAVIGGERRSWGRDEAVPGIWENEEFLLGDFTNLAAFLAKNRPGWRAHDDGA